uniref:Neur_chan_memb domain-containing protein n=1 Tax=Heterorhabditis bacteriophora TaxID=37862 RepID=A0A1I7WVG3_HETBA
MIVRWDPCGIICVIMIYGCVVYADYVVTVWMVMPVFGES